MTQDSFPALTGEAEQTDTAEFAEVRSLGSRTVIGAGWMIAWPMVTRTMGFASMLILARLLVPADFGLVAMASAFSAGIDSLSQLGLAPALVRRPDTGRTLYDTAFTMQVIRGCITASVIGVSALGASAWFGEPRLLPILLILAGLAALTGLENIGIVEFQKSLRFDKEFRLLSVPRIMQFLTTTFLAYELRSYWALIIGIVVGRIGRLVTTHLVHPYRPRLSLAKWRDLMGFSFWMWASSMVGMVWDRCDPFLLGPALGISLLGVYLLAGEIALLPTSELVAPAAGALFAGVSAAQNRGKLPVEVALSVASALLIVVAPVAIGFSATSSYIIAGLLGPKWMAGRSVLALFSLLSILTPFTFVCGTVLSAAGFVRQSFYATAAAAALRVAAVWSVAATRRRDSIGSFGRTAVAAIVVAAAFYLSGFGWSDTSDTACARL